MPLADDAVIAEPEARGTGPALGLANRWILAEDPEAIISSVHADSHVEDNLAYCAAVLAAAGWAAATRGLATVGVTPTYPSTGLGYVALTGAPRLADPWQAPPGSAVSTALMEAAAAVPAFPAAGFVEKPGLEVARAYLAGARHLWNTGLFAWPAAVFEEELAAADAELAGRVAAAVEKRRQGDETAAASIYSSIEPVAVDTLVFERTRRLTVVRGWFSWSDLGTFADLHVTRGRAGEADPGGNIAEGDVIAVDFAEQSRARSRRSSRRRRRGGRAGRGGHSRRSSRDPPQPIPAGAPGRRETAGRGTLRSPLTGRLTRRRAPPTRPLRPPPPGASPC